MSLIQEYNELEEVIRVSQARLDEISSNEEFKVEKEFDTKLRELLGAYGKSLRDIIAILDPSRLPSGVIKQGKGKQERRPRVLKVYLNPHSSERVETKGGNHALLKKWKAEYGGDVVESWLQA